MPKGWGHRASRYRKPLPPHIKYPLESYEKIHKSDLAEINSKVCESLGISEKQRLEHREEFRKRYDEYIKEDLIRFKKSNCNAEYARDVMLMQELLAMKGRNIPVFVIHGRKTSSFKSGSWEPDLFHDRISTSSSEYIALNRDFLPGDMSDKEAVAHFLAEIQHVACETDFELACLEDLLGEKKYMWAAHAVNLFRTNEEWVCRSIWVHDTKYPLEVMTSSRIRGSFTDHSRRDIASGVLKDLALYENQSKRN